MDKVFESFLGVQQQKVQELDAASDIFSCSPIAGNPPWRHLMEFKCRGLVRVAGNIEEANYFAVGLTFGPDHLRVPPEIPEILTLLKPEQAFFPNVRFPFICIGDIKVATGIVEIAHRCYEVLSYQRFFPIEKEALNHEACSWVRNNLERFPLDARPLKRPPLPLNATITDEARS